MHIHDLAFLFRSRRENISSHAPALCGRPHASAMNRRRERKEVGRAIPRSGRRAPPLLAARAAGVKAKASAFSNADEVVIVTRRAGGRRGGGRCRAERLVQRALKVARRVLGEARISLTSGRRRELDAVLRGLTLAALACFMRRAPAAIVAHCLTRRASTYASFHERFAKVVAKCRRRNRVRRQRRLAGLARGAKESDDDGGATVAGDYGDGDGVARVPQHEKQKPEINDTELDSDSDDVIIVEEISPAAAARRMHSSDPSASSPRSSATLALNVRRRRVDADEGVDMAASALGLFVKSEQGFGNCMFCAASSGFNSWLRALRASSVIDWSDLRSVLVRALRRIVRDAPAVEASRLGNNNVSVTAARETAMDQLMAGSEGRAWLTRGDLARASVPTRFDAHLAVMGQDAAPHAGTHRWTRYWGTDIELTVIAAAMRCAVVCVECASSSPFYLAIPADVAEISGDASGLLRLGRYMPHGTVGELSDEVGGFTLVWSAARRRVRLRVRLVDAWSNAAADAANAAAAVNSWTGDEEQGHVAWTAPHPRETCWPAMVVVHRRGHFDSLQPPPDCVLVLEREDVEP